MQLLALKLFLLLLSFESQQARASRQVSNPPATTSFPSQSTCHNAIVHSLTQPLPQICPVTRSSSLQSATINSHIPPNNFKPSESNSTPVVVTSSILQEQPTTAVSTADSPNDGLELGPTGTRSESEPPSASLSADVSATAVVNNDGEKEEEEDFGFPLGHVDFLSFEDWKQQKLAHAGQSVDAVRNQKVRGSGSQYVSMQSALDSLGDDAEIELDFGGLVGVSTTNVEYSGPSPDNAPDSWPSAGVRNDNRPPGRLRSKDAGKTCKERSNYASFDCAANVLKTNPKCKSASSVLVEHKDSYMLNECAIDNKFLIVELCDNIKIDTVVLANFEFFSSMFRTFRVSVSDRYPVRIDRWKVLGTYEARNSRDIQAFLVTEPLIWARYLRIEFLTHFGSEFYCPLSLLRVHGTTMMEEFRYEQEFARGELEPDDEAQSSVESDLADHVSNEAQVVQMPIESETASPTSVATGPSDAPRDRNSLLLTYPELARFNEQQTLSLSEHTSHVAVCLPNDGFLSLFELEHEPTCSIDRMQDPATSSKTVSSAQVNEGPGETHRILAANERQEDKFSNTNTDKSLSRSIPDLVESRMSSSPQQVFKTSIVSTITPPVRDYSSSSEDKSNSEIVPPGTTPSTSIPTASISAHANNLGEESFFKSIHKRLQALETNASLSMQYIESQSFILREAFSKVEKRQMAKTSLFLESLNTSIFEELSGFRREYENLWQNTVSELAGQREQIWQDREAMGERIRILAEEMVSQKRLMAAQATLLLLCLAIVVFAKNVPGAGLEAGLLQSMHGFVKRKKTPRDIRAIDREPWQWDGAWGSPHRSAASTRPSTSEKAHNQTSAGSTPERQYSPHLGHSSNASNFREFGNENGLSGMHPLDTDDLTDETQSAPSTPHI